MRKWAPVRVEWDDANGADEGWQSATEIDHAPVRVVTVGMLYKKTRSGTTVVLSRTGESIGGFVFIPSGNIVEIRELT